MDIILEWLKEHSDLSAAQVEDWLLEEYPNVQVSSSTVRSYVKNLREQYAIPKRKNIRHYEAIPEVEMGAQIQVDWGQTKQMCFAIEKYIVVQRKVHNVAPQ